MGPRLAYGSQPNPENEAAATAHLTLEGMRDTYLRGVPSDVAARIPAESWEEDWRVMLAGAAGKERALVADYATTSRGSTPSPTISSTSNRHL